MLRPRADGWLPDELGRVHMVGIGGSGMSGIARVLHERGHMVSGTDRAASEVTESLAASGITVFIGEDSGFVDQADTVISTYAVRDNHPEMVRARERGITVLHRADALRFIARGLDTIAVGGSHGKTTSTAILATAMERLGEDITAVNGGVISQWGVSARAGSSSWCVLEADESDASFLIYHPRIALVTNVAADHLDFYGSREAVFAAFDEFVLSATDAVVCLDDDGARALVGRLAPREVLTYGTHPDAALRLSDVTVAPYARAVVTFGTQSASFELAVPGELNALNATGVIGVLLLAGWSLDDAARGVSGFTGADRRFQFHGEIGGIRVFDDHAHHPTEVATALDIAQTVAGQGEVITMFQPHLFSRTQLMSAELAEAFRHGSDHTIFLDIFGSREDPIEGVTTQMILDRLGPAVSYDFEPDWDRAVDLAVSRAQPGDVIVTMSTGDLYQIVPRLLKQLRKVHERAVDVFEDNSGDEETGPSVVGQ
ncbi:UDP-N-acetylmuramate--alanine ligase [Pontimonas salivibrio]|uniref:UDP-N-acetylmuramate--L-alanine ligase n=1 Tax=Pontimonas salivibrio TaxID=1159327 RepID=A0A2L2BQL2_9MICO|nr:UDP-N-acetylmuramate--L-alanine ligase [Pontimonas salivibrio]AVG23950.1 UDP-N-acetylmuramate--alanine ligase [Pontimonas salivibrio]